MRSFKISVVRFLTVAVAMLMLGTSTFAQVSVTLPDVSGIPGSTGTGAITVGDLTGKNVTAFEFTINYDKNLFYITGATEGTLLGSNAPTVNADTANGKISVAWASATALSGSGNLVVLHFSFRSTGSQALTATPFIFNAGNPTVTLTDGVASVPAVLVQGGSVSASAGDDIVIPIMVTALTAAQNVVSYNFVGSFPAALIEITSADLTGTLSAGGTPAINVDNTAGTISFAWANAANITTEGGTLLNLKGKAKAVGTAQLTFSSFTFNAGSPIASASAAQVMIGELNVAPTLTFTPVATPYVVNEGQLLTVTLVGDDANAGDVSSLVYTASANNPAGSKLTGSVFTWTPGYDQGRPLSYTLEFTVTDQGGLSVTKSIIVKVNNVNRAPVFTAELAPYTEVQVHVAPNPVFYTFQYEAEDLDGDELSFSLVSNPAGSSITEDGLFSWAPTVDQAGKSFVVTVQVTDGTTATLSNQVISASATIVGVDVEEMPTEFSLSQNYPNPFNPTTSIRFGIPNESHVKLTVFNILGQEVAMLVNKQMSSGFHNVNFDASKLNTGMYIYRIEAGSFVSVKKMLFVK